MSVGRRVSRLGFNMDIKALFTAPDQGPLLVTGPMNEKGYILQSIPLFG